MEASLRGLRAVGGDPQAAGGCPPSQLCLLSSPLSSFSRPLSLPLQLPPSLPPLFSCRPLPLSLRVEVCEGAASRPHSLPRTQLEPLYSSLSLGVDGSPSRAQGSGGHTGSLSPTDQEALGALLCIALD
eukprot:scaffold173664_cov33-Tisochrysis_lutea.AAC.1